MNRDPLFFRLFTELPSCFFQLVGRDERDAARYQLEAIEYKATSVRLDGVFRPKSLDAGPAYIWEAQFYRSDKFYANLLTKIGRFLEHGDPAQDWIAVAIYPTRALEQKNLEPYRCLLDSNQMVRVYLDELPPATPDQFEMGILDLIASRPETAMKKAQAMVPKLRTSKQPEKLRTMLLQLIETVIVHQFPNYSREEIEAMLQVTDFRQTRVYREAVEEGIERGVETVATRMIEMGRPAPEVAKLTGLTVAQVRSLIKKSKK